MAITPPPSTSLTRPSIFPGFTPLSSEIYSREGLPTESTTESSAPAPNPTHPRVIIIFAWGDAQPKHILKYAAGFQSLYPHARQIAVLAPIYKALWRTMAQRVEAMKPIIEATYPRSAGTEGKEENGEEEAHDGNVLIQVMSNTGGINYAATLHAYRDLYNRPLPHKLVCFDSTPGSTELTFENMKRMSLAMALGTASWFPWPMSVTQFLWAGFMYSLSAVESVMGIESASVQSVKAVTSSELLGLVTRQLYLYGKEDPIILWSDIERHIAGARSGGWKTQARLFEGSGHVEHMRSYPVEYWGALKVGWEEAVGEGSA
ncbi:hypothetical protein BJX70DRAFT_361557 [Aspergillus crustosus]